MTETTTAPRHVQAKNRWHAIWVIIRESFRHPRTATIVEWKKR
jgi:hypothetical protein